MADHRPTRMRRAWQVAVGIVSAICAGIVWAVIALQPPAAPEMLSDHFTLTGVTIVNPLSNRQENAALTVRNGIIRRGDTPSGSRADKFSFPGHYVLPGLINTHVHLPNDTPFHLTEFVGLLYLAHGVTTIRDAGDIPGNSAATARRVFTTTDNPGPRIQTCGPLVEGLRTGTYNMVVYDRTTDASEIINHVLAAGGECIKAHDNLDPERTAALVAAADQAGLPVIGHISHGMTLENSAIPNVQHQLGVVAPDVLKDRHDLLYRRIDWRSVTDERIREAVAVSVEKGITHTPTLVSLENLGRFEHAVTDKGSGAPIMPRMFRDVLWHPETGVLYRNLGAQEFDLIRDAQKKRLAMVHQLHQAGVPLQLGTDDLQPFGTPGDALWREMSWFETAGIPAPDIWSYGTWASAPEFDVPMLGRIIPGAPADLLIFSKDPTEAVANMDSLVAIISNGRLYRREDLLSAIRAYRAYYQRIPVDFLSVMASRIAISLAAESQPD